jgi:hypothetical protein
MRYLITLLIATGCSGFIENQAASSTLKLLKQTSVAGQRLADVELAREAAPGGVVQLAAFAAAYPERREFRELHAEAACGYALGFVFDDWEDATFNHREADANKLAKRLQGLLSTCVDVNLALLPEAWRDRARWAQLLPTATRDEVPALVWIASADAARMALDPLSGMSRLDPTIATLARCIELAPGFHEAAAEIMLGSLLAGKSRFLGGPNGEAQFIAARKSGGILVDVMYARGVAVAKQDRDLFLKHLDLALAADLSKWPEQRLSNELARVKAERYRAAIDTLIPSEKR